MIVKAAPQRQSGRGSFIDLRTYLERDDLGHERQDLVMTWSGNVASHATADIDMEQVGALGRLSDPVYHVILSWRPGEEIKTEVARGAVDAVLRSIGAEDYQWYGALHRDEADGRTHLHLMVNRVHPITHRGLDLWRSNAKLARAAEWTEREYGCLVDRRMSWREQLTEVDLGFSITAAEAHVRQTIAHGVHAEPPGAQQSEMDAVRRAGYSWTTLLQREAIPAALAVTKREGSSWNDLHTVLETYHVHLERAGSGLRIVGPEPGQHLKASRAGLVFRELEQKLGAYVESPKASSDFSARLGQAKDLVGKARSWEELHQSLADIQLTVERRGNGGRVKDLEGSGRSAPLGRIGTSMPKLEKRLGNYEASEELRLQALRETQRRQEAVAERLAAICEDATPLLERIVAHHAVWTAVDVEFEIARMVGVERGELREHHIGSLDAAREQVLSRSKEIGVEERLSSINADGVGITAPFKLYSTPEVIEEERRAFAAVQAVFERRRTLSLRAASQELDAQQRAAYEHLADGASDLKVVTGIAGAGKSRLLREVCAAYSEAGYDVIGSAVAGSAARVLGEEANIPTRTMARLLLDVEGGKQRLSERSVVVVDEASMLGTADASRLFEAARGAGARVLLLGDAQQHEAVARGPVLGEIVERHAACDLSTTRRAQEQWLRDVGMDLRAGRTARALDVLRERSCVAEHETNEDAMAALVGRYVGDVQAGREALLIATRRSEVLRLNELVRDAMRGQLGEERTYSTAFGDRMFAVGDRVVTREPHRLSGTVNGDTWVVSAHRDDGRIVLVRDRDGASVTWNLRENAALDHGYASTSYRGQGRTVDSAYVLATSAGAQRGLYVDVTRARKDVLIAYGRDQLADFGALLNVGATSRAKLTVASVEREAAARQLREEVVNTSHSKTSKVTDAEARVFKRSETFVQSMRMTMNRLEPGQQIEGVLAWKEKIPETDSYYVVLVKDSQGVAWRSTVQVENELRYGDRVTIHAGLGEKNAKLLPQQNQPQLRFRL